MRGSAAQLGILGLIGVLSSCMVGNGLTPALDISPTSSTRAIPTPATTSAHSPQPSNTPTNVPPLISDVPLYDDGMWLLFQGKKPDDGERNSHLWVANWDGTGLTDLLPDFYVYQYEVQPSVDGSPGRYVAAITSYGWSDKFMFTLAHLPDGGVVANIPLINPETELVDWVPLGDPNYEDHIRRQTLSMSISDLRSLAWSPDGTQIAFSGAQDGKQTDLYIYSLKNGSVSRLTQGQHPHHASNLLWSPNGQHITYDDVSNNVQYRYIVDGIWVAHVDGSVVKQIASIDEWPSVGEWGSRLQKMGWTSDHTIAVYALEFERSNLKHLKEVDVDTGRTSTIIGGDYCGAAFASEQDVWLVEIHGFGEGETYLIRDGAMNKVGTFDCCLPIWSSKLNAFITPQGLVNTDGEQVVLDLPESQPLISPDGAYWAYPRGYRSLEPEEEIIVTKRDALWIGETGRRPQKLSDLEFEVIQWSANSRSVLVTNNKEGLQYVAIAPDFELRLISQYDTNQHFGPWEEGKALDN